MGPKLANAEQLKALIRSHAEDDDGRFYSIALQVAAQAARSGHGRLAIELRDLIDESQARLHASSKVLRPSPSSYAIHESVESLININPAPDLRLSQMTLNRSTLAKIDRILLEHHKESQLRSYGYTPITKILLSGPPGTGKTMTASVLATELRLPLFTVRIDSVITKFLGETASKLRTIFDSMRGTKGVYFFDEIDALAADRGQLSDTTELRRVSNSMLQFIEQDQSASLLIGATNLSSIIDRAAFRRFDSVITYSLPTQQEIANIILSRLANIGTAKDVETKVLPCLIGLSQADIVSACDQAAKSAILEGRTHVKQSDLASAFAELDRR